MLGLPVSTHPPRRRYEGAAVAADSVTRIDDRPPSFAELGVDPALVARLSESGIVVPSPVQVLTIPDALAGVDVAAQAPTGSGKTLAFGLPMIQCLAARSTGPERAGREQASDPTGLVIAPTRELARQIGRTLQPLAATFGLRVHAVYGGVPFEPQIDAFRRGIDIVVACPGRLLDLIDQGHACLDAVTVLVIDEADRLADLGFLPDVDRLLQHTPPRRQTVVLSATLDGPVVDLLATAQRDPVHHHVSPSEQLPVRHHFWLVAPPDQVPLLADLADHCGPTIAFSNTRRRADHVGRQLARLGVRVSLLHGGNDQERRADALDRFANGESRVLVATDVASRGLHIDNVACVVHLELPTDASDYVHRAGRTGRAGAVGTVVAFIDPAADAPARRLLRRVAASFPGDMVDEAEFTAPQVFTLESAGDRVAIDHEMVALGTLIRPGAVGTVKFGAVKIAPIEFAPASITWRD